MKIGTLEFDTFEGEIFSPVRSSRKFQYAGEDGSLIIRDGKRERTAIVTTTRTYLDQPAAEAALIEIEAMPGELTVVIDSLDRQHDNVFVEDAQAIIKEVLCPSTDETHTRQIITMWKLMKRIDVAQ